MVAWQRPKPRGHRFARSGYAGAETVQDPFSRAEGTDWIDRVDGAGGRRFSWYAIGVSDERAFRVEYSQTRLAATLEPGERPGQ